MEKKVRVRFAPSPTGGLHVGGVRTILFNYLFAKKNNGKFIVRTEDTDQSRFVEGAEEYIFNCLEWCGLIPDESVFQGGEYGPYRQSERKDIYNKYAHELVEKGFAYYAFDTQEEIEEMRKQFSVDGNMAAYNFLVRNNMNNQFKLGYEEAKKKVDAGEKFVVRIKMPENEEIQFTDLIRGEVSFNSNTVDDKVLLKADGMPTYHLAVVVDDYLMKISHAFRGEEWLPSAPVHIKLWDYLGWKNEMPQWAHLPLILGPSGKLSKRDGDKYGFPVYAMNWTDPKKNITAEGFKEKGFLPEAFLNFLASLGWNDGSEQEIFSVSELIEKFSIEKVHKAGAKFDFEKAKWFNHEWIKKLSAEELLPTVKEILISEGFTISNENYLLQVIELVKDRCTLLPDFIQQSSFFFKNPTEIDIASILPKWNLDKKIFFEEWLQLLQTTNSTASEIENIFKELATQHQLKTGELMLPLRIMLVGGKFGPGVFDIVKLIGETTTKQRVLHTLSLLN